MYKRLNLYKINYQKEKGEHQMMMFILKACIIPF